MGVRPALILLGVAATAAGCGGRSGRSAHVFHRVPPTPSLAQQVERAERVGPGYLIYCPRHSGVAPAAYSLTVPGGAIAAGWCRTRAERRKRLDVITFESYWDGTRAGEGKGTQRLTYAISRRSAPTSSPVPALIEQAGAPPP